MSPALLGAKSGIPSVSLASKNAGSAVAPVPVVSVTLAALEHSKVTVADSSSTVVVPDKLTALTEMPSEPEVTVPDAETLGAPGVIDKLISLELPALTTPLPANETIESESQIESISHVEANAAVEDLIVKAVLVAAIASLGTSIKETVLEGTPVVLPDESVSVPLVDTVSEQVSVDASPGLTGKLRKIRLVKECLGYIVLPTPLYPKLVLLRSNQAIPFLGCVLLVLHQLQSRYKLHRKFRRHPGRDRCVFVPAHLQQQRDESKSCF